MLTVRRFGSGPRLVALHGFTYTGEQFSRLAPLIGRAIDAPDLPGHGSNATAPTDLESTIGAVAEVLGEPVDVLGYSQGARLALLVALERPQLFTSLVLVSGTAGIDDEAQRASRARTDAELARDIRTHGVEVFLDRWTSTGITDTSHLDAATRISDRGTRSTSSANGLARALEGFGQGAQPSMWHRLANMAVPTLLLTGGRDDTYTQIGAAMCDAMPRASLITVPDAGHNPMLDAPMRTASAISAFLEGTEEP